MFHTHCRHHHDCHYDIRSKHTAAGQKEIVMFFWLYAIISLLAMFFDSGVIPTANVSYLVGSISFLVLRLSPYSSLSSKQFAATYTGLVATAYYCLLINGFVSFRFAEDGTPLSLWVRKQPSTRYVLLNEQFLPSSYV